MTSPFTPATIPSAGTGTGAITQIETSTLGAAGTFDFQSIPGTYLSLRVEFQLRGTDAGALDSLRMRFNNDTTNKYYTEKCDGTAATFNVSELIVASSLYLGIIPAAGAGSANLTACGYVEIPNYASTSWYQGWISHFGFGVSGNSGDTHLELSSGWWESNAAVTRVQLFGATTANLAIGSIATLYGIGS